MGFSTSKQTRKIRSKQCTRPNKRWGVIQMISGCFAGMRLGPIAFIDRRVNSDVYIALLCNYLLPFIDALVADGVSNIIFQQDNASSHTSKKTQEWFRNAIEQHGFTVMDWPLNSPDMNPIEHLGAYLKNELYQRYPDTKTLY